MYLNDFLSSFQLFDEGHNIVTMNLPKAIKNLKKQQQKPVANNEPMEEAPVSAPMVSKQILDVEYEDDYDSEDGFNGIESLAQQTEPKKADPGVRDYSLDVWNGSPGLKHWGFDDDDSEK